MTKKSGSAPAIRGFSLSASTSVRELAAQMKDAGLQAGQLGQAAEIIHEMQKEKAAIILTFTTNLVSSGLREVIAELVKRRKVSAIITAIGSVEEDVMKTQVDFEQGSFDADDWQLREQGRNRVGNIIIPTAAYEKLEKVLMPFFEKEYEKQQKLGRMLAPNEIIRDLGLELKDEHSFVYWAAKNNIPVFCPAPTDGAFGLQLYFFKQKRPAFGIDVSGDLKPLGQLVLDANKTGGIILGGGVAKHHAIGENLLREGFDYAVYVSTGTPYDGSLSGARVNEAVSWGKVSAKAKIVHVEADASIAFPILAAGMLGE
ncbi:putative deoxyhypusine synthase [uncultured archaeon]|nr:putative deoxyhypusine synthase [uncultured archaeon]